MKLIDADALIEEINKRIKSAHEWYDEAPTEEVKRRAEQAIATFCEASLTAKKMPTIEPEQKKGWWEIYIISMLDGEGCRCSGCKFEGAPQWHFCPNCGAKMEGVKKDETD